MLTKDDVMSMIAVVKVHYAFNYKNFTADDYVILANSWYEDLKGYPKELVFEAFNQAKRVQKIAITTADIIEQITKMQEAFNPSLQEKWVEFKRILKSAESEASLYRGYGFSECREFLQKIYDGMLPEFQRYCGGFSGMIDICLLEDEQMEFEKTRFLKQIGEYKKQTEIQQNPALQRLIESTVKTLDKGKL